MGRLCDDHRQNLYYDDETGELFFPFARHARGHGHALLEVSPRGDNVTC